MTVAIEQLSAYYDGELSAEERRTVDSHLPECPDCQSVLRRWLQISRVLVAEPSRGRPRWIPVGLLALAAVLFISGVAIAGPFNQIFRSGNVSGLGSRPVSLEEARVANLPLPRSDQLPGGWRINQVQLVVTPTWRSVDVQYQRPGSRGMGVTAWSQDITVNPTAERTEVINVSGIPVEIFYGGGGNTQARFTHGASTVIVRVFADEVDVNGIRALVGTWVEQAR